MSASTTITKVTTTNLTIDDEGRIVLPPEALRALRPDGERLTLLDVEIGVENGTLVLRRSAIDEEDWWAYTPEQIARIEHASAQDGIRLTRDELERMIAAHDGE